MSSLRPCEDGFRRLAAKVGDRLVEHAEELCFVPQVSGNYRRSRVLREPAPMIREEMQVVMAVFGDNLPYLIIRHFLRPFRPVAGPSSLGGIPRGAMYYPIPAPMRAAHRLAVGRYRRGVGEVVKVLVYLITS